MKEKKLTAIEQKVVPFYDDELVAIRGNDEQIYVSIRHLVNALGLNPTGQIRRIRRQKVLAKGLLKGDILSPQGKRSANLLRVDLVPLFLSGISLNSVREDLQEKLEVFQEESAKVLWEAFQEGRLTSDPIFEDLLESNSEAVQAYKMLQALTKIARSQVILEGRVDSHEKRLEQIESTLGDSGQNITPDQASQISQAVKTVAHAMGGHGKHYQSIYGEMYRKFGITSYKQLPKNKFQQTLDWLTEWHKSIANKAPL